jgi:hypothetical protein
VGLFVSLLVALMIALCFIVGLSSCPVNCIVALNRALFDLISSI